MERWFDRLLAVMSSVLPAILLGIVLVVVSANVIARTLLGLPFYAAHDLAMICFAGVVWFGVVGAAINGQLFGVAWFVSLLPPRLGRAARLLSNAIVILVAVAVIQASAAQIGTARFTRFLALGWPKWIVSAGLLGAMVMLILVQLREIWREVRGQGEAP